MSGDAPKRSVTVRIGGEEHVLRSTADPDYARACAEFLDDRVREIREAGGVMETHRAVILAALSITDRYFQILDDLERLQREVASRSNNLTRRIEDELAAGSGEGGGAEG